jgi:hypothetical protein
VRDARAVDEQVEAAEGGDNAAHHSVDTLAVAHVQVAELHIPVPRGPRLLDTHAPCLLVEVADDDEPAVA